MIIRFVNVKEVLPEFEFDVQKRLEADIRIRTNSYISLTELSQYGALE
jgi:hypothetical protein